MALTVKQTIDKFPDYVCSLGNTESTAKAYLCDIMQFYGYIQEMHKNLIYIDNLKRNHFIDYFLCLQKQVIEKKYCRSTADRKTDSLIVFCSYLFEMGYTKENLLCGYKFKRIKQRFSKDYNNDFNPYVFNDKELEELIETIQKEKSNNKYRDLLIFEMLIELGIRRSTLLAASWEDVNFHEKAMTLHHVKDQLTTKVKISDNLCNALIDYQFVSNQNTGKILLSNKGTSLSPSAFNDTVTKYLKQTGTYKKGATSHSFRHTFITKAFKNNINEYKIIKYTGHRDISSLKPYENLIANDLEDLCIVTALPITYFQNSKENQNVNRSN